MSRPTRLPVHRVHYGAGRGAEIRAIRNYDAELGTGPSVRVPYNVLAGGNLPALGYVGPGTFTALQAAFYQNLVDAGVPPDKARFYALNPRIAAKYGNLSAADLYLLTVGGADLGALAGAGIGFALGGELGSTAGPIGAGIGAVVGALGGALAGVLGGGSSSPARPYGGRPHGRTPSSETPPQNDESGGFEQALEAIPPAIAGGVNFANQLASALEPAAAYQPNGPPVSSSVVPSQPQPVEPYYPNPSTEVLPSNVEYAPHEQLQAPPLPGRVQNLSAYDWGFQDGKQGEQSLTANPGGTADSLGEADDYIPGRSEAAYDAGYKAGQSQGGQSTIIPTQGGGGGGGRYPGNQGGDCPQCDQLHLIEEQLDQEIATEESQQTAQTTPQEINQQIDQIAQQVQQFRQLENQPVTQRDISEELRQKSVIKGNIRDLIRKAKKVAEKVTFCMQCDSNEDAAKFLNGEVAACTVAQGPQLQGGQPMLNPVQGPQLQAPPLPGRSPDPDYNAGFRAGQSNAPWPPSFPRSAAWDQGYADAQSEKADSAGTAAERPIDDYDTGFRAGESNAPWPPSFPRSAAWDQGYADAQSEKADSAGTAAER